MHIAQHMPLPLTVSCSSKSRLVLPFWYLLTWVVLDKIQRSSKTTVFVRKRHAVLLLLYCKACGSTSQQDNKDRTIHINADSDLSILGNSQSSDSDISVVVSHGSCVTATDVLHDIYIQKYIEHTRLS